MEFKQDIFIAVLLRKDCFESILTFSIDVPMYYRNMDNN
jgi:hypothetical protein